QPLPVGRGPGLRLGPVDLGGASLAHVVQVGQGPKAQILELGDPRRLPGRSALWRADGRRVGAGPRAAVLGRLTHRPAHSLGVNSASITSSSSPATPEPPEPDRGPPPSCGPGPSGPDCAPRPAVARDW